MKTKRVGKAMAAVVMHLERGPKTLIDVARAVGPHGSLQYGYRTIDRAARAGLIEICPPLPGRRGMSICKAGDRSSDEGSYGAHAVVGE